MSFFVPFFHKFVNLFYQFITFSYFYLTFCDFFWLSSQQILVSQDVKRTTHTNVPKTSFKDLICASSWARPNLTYLGRLKMTSKGRLWDWEVDSGRPQDVLRMSTRWSWKHVWRMMSGHLLKFLFTFHWEIIWMTKSTLNQFITQGVYRIQLNF